LVDAAGKLAGALSVIIALQADPDTPLRELADLEPIHVHPEADIVEVTTRMSDYNLLTLPVVDHDHQLIGLITVDDALEAAIPEDWHHRESVRRSNATVEPD